MRGQCPSEALLPKALSSERWSEPQTTFCVSPNWFLLSTLPTNVFKDVSTELSILSIQLSSFCFFWKPLGCVTFLLTSPSIRSLLIPLYSHSSCQMSKPFRNKERKKKKEKTQKSKLREVTSFKRIMIRPRLLKTLTSHKRMITLIRLGKGCQS